MSTVQQQAASRVADIAGGQAELARQLGVRMRGRPFNGGTIGHWVSGRRPIPPAHARVMLDLAGGQVPLREMRPDDWHLIWPELVGAEGAPAVPAPSFVLEGAE